MSQLHYNFSIEERGLFCPKKIPESPLTSRVSRAVQSSSRTIYFGKELTKQTNHLLCNDQYIFYFNNNLLFVLLNGMDNCLYVRTFSFLDIKIPVKNIHTTINNAIFILLKTECVCRIKKIEALLNFIVTIDKECCLSNRTFLWSPSSESVLV